MQPKNLYRAKKPSSKVPGDVHSDSQGRNLLGTGFEVNVCECCGSSDHRVDACDVARELEEAIQEQLEQPSQPTTFQPHASSQMSMGTQRGRSRKEASTEPKLLPKRTLLEHIRVDVLDDFASRRACLFIDVKSNDEADLEAHGHHQEDLRSRIAYDLHRAEFFKPLDKDQFKRAPNEQVFPVLYKEDRLSTATATQGRLVAGFKISDLNADYEFFQFIEVMSSQIGDYPATRSCFNAKRFYRQLARPSNTVDLDQRKSFQSAALESYPNTPLPATRIYVTNFPSFCEDCKADTPEKVDAVKIFVNSIPGAGFPAQHRVLEALCLDRLPKMLIMIWDEIKGLAECDLVSFDRQEVLRGGGQSSNLAAKAFYVRRAEKEHH